MYMHESLVYLVHSLVHKSLGVGHVERRVEMQGSAVHHLKHGQLIRHVGALFDCLQA